MSRGGTRPGAGRKRKDDARVTLSVRVKPETREEIESLARAFQSSMGEIIDRFVQYQSIDG